MKKYIVFLVFSIMIMSGVSAVEQSHPFSQIITQGPDNEGIDILDDMDMNDNAIHNTRALYIGGSGYADGLAPGFIGHNSVENRIALYSTTNKPVTVGFSPDAGIESDLLVTGDAEIQGGISGYNGNELQLRDGISMNGNLITDVPSIGKTESNIFFNDDGSMDINAGSSDVVTLDGNLRVKSSFWVDGTKNFVHDINQTHEAVYTSQESASARAVLEGTVKVEGGSETVELPDHFEEVVSDDKPDIKIQLTPRELTTVAATERSQDRFTVKTGKNSRVEIDYRVTGVREGFEDPEVVRRK